MATDLRTGNRGESNGKRCNNNNPVVLPDTGSTLGSGEIPMKQLADPAAVACAVATRMIGPFSSLHLSTLMSEL